MISTMDATVKGATRRDRAEATRRKIVRAAHDEFVERGYHGATIASVARRAGVAPQTVYFVFHNKPALISAVIDAAVMGEAEPAVPEATPWWTAMETEPRAGEALGIFIRGAGPLFARASRISEILRAAALTDEEVRRTHEHHEALRLEAFRQVIDTIAGKGRLRDGLDPTAATDILFTLYGDSTYHTMTAERGWSHDRFIDWLCHALPSLLLEPDPDA